MRRICFVISALTIAGQAQAQKVAPAKAFGMRPEIIQVSLSPSGNRVAYLAATDARGATLYIVDLVSGSAPKAVIKSSGDPEHLGQCSWVSDARLICIAYEQKMFRSEISAASKLFAINADGSDMKRVSIRQGQNAQYAMSFGGSIIDMLPGDDGAVLVGRQYVPESNINTRIEKRDEGYGVDRIDTATLATKRVVRPTFNASEYISDGIGNVRIMGEVRSGTGGYADTRTIYQFRSLGKDDWQPLSVYDQNTQQGFNPYAVDPTANVAYGFDRVDGKQALFKVALDGSNTRTLVFSRPDVDVDDIVRIGRKQRVIGVSFATEKRNVVYFDEGMKKLAADLGKALPKAGFIGLVDANSDESKLVIWAGSDIDPGQYYHLDRKTNRMTPLFLERPELENVHLAEVKPITYTASDGTKIPAYLTLPPGSAGKKLPAIVMPHGGPRTRDEWGFDWLAQFFVSRGYAVIQPNYRGSSGYGDAWFRNMGFKAWNVAVGDVNDAGRWLIAQGIADLQKLAIVGWSYGGYAALQSGVVAPNLFKAIVAVAPVTDLGSLKTDAQKQWDYRVKAAFIGTGPHVTAGSPAQNASAIRAPVLMFHGDLDQNVSIFQSRMMEGKLKGAGKQVRLVEFFGLAHNLTDSTARERLLSESDSFLRSSMGL